MQAQGGFKCQLLHTSFGGGFRLEKLSINQLVATRQSQGPFLKLWPCGLWSNKYSEKLHIEFSLLLLVCFIF